MVNPDSGKLSVQFELMASRLGMDRAEFMEFIQLFVSTTRAELDKIRQGLVHGAAKDAAAAAHSIKGAAGNLGFMDMFDLAQTMETQAKAGLLDEFGDHMARICAMVDLVEGQVTGE